MSSSYRKDRVHWISIHNKLPNVTVDDFKGRRELLVKEHINIPVVQENLVKLDFIISNNMLDDYIKAAGLPAPSPVILLSGECATRDHVVQITDDPGVQALVQQFPELRPGRNVSVLVADSKVLLDKESHISPSNRVHRFAMLEVPEGVAPHDCEAKLDALSNRFTKLALVQKNVLRRTVLATSVDNLDSAMRQLNVQLAKLPTFIIQEEYETQSNMMELLNSAEYKQILVEIKKIFSTSIFCADVITMLNNA
ncbi:hypothetical protein FB45DRAFT_1028895 [Roridomyces roridus]|uniref:Uncharacterized protein n=1 Tax=Roridomyces roridus TaxID=1738132 RepID=A0AAD7BRS9_9AGAR|nr:hypothetical protein FB45DRAFT_1028895 [Roridomyces roridus]